MAPTPRSSVARGPAAANPPQTFACTFDGCEKSFTRQKDCKRHEDAIHRKIRHFKCPYAGCGQAFLHGSGLKIHLSAHNPRYTLKCPKPGCLMCFNEDEGAYRRHYRIVHMAVRYDCGICAQDGTLKEFKRKVFLRRHILGVHNGLFPSNWTDQEERGSRGKVPPAEKLELSDESANDAGQLTQEPEAQGSAYLEGIQIPTIPVVAPFPPFTSVLPQSATSDVDQSEIHAESDIDDHDLDDLDKANARLDDYRLRRSFADMQMMRSQEGLEVCPKAATSG